MVALTIKFGAKAIKNKSHILDKEMIPKAKKIKPTNIKSSIYDVIKKNYLAKHIYFTGLITNLKIN